MEKEPYYDNELDQDEPPYEPTPEDLGAYNL